MPLEVGLANSGMSQQGGGYRSWRKSSRRAGHDSRKCHLARASGYCWAAAAAFTVQQGFVGEYEVCRTIVTQGEADDSGRKVAQQGPRIEERHGRGTGTTVSPHQVASAPG